jgi:hypothetical protein
VTNISQRQCHSSLAVLTYHKLLKHNQYHSLTCALKHVFSLRVRFRISCHCRFFTAFHCNTRYRQLQLLIYKTVIHTTPQKELSTAVNVYVATVTLGNLCTLSISLIVWPTQVYEGVLFGPSQSKCVKPLDKKIWNKRGLMKCEG